LLERFADLGDLPKSPIVAKRALDQPPVGQTEVDVRFEGAGQRIIGGLLPDVRDAAALVRLEARLLGGDPAEDVEEEEPSRMEPAMDRGEVGRERPLRLENEVAEVVCDADVGRDPDRIEDALFEEANARELARVAALGGGERAGIEIDGDSA